MFCTPARFMELKELRKFAKYPKKYLNAKLARGQIHEKAESLKIAEKSAINQTLLPNFENLSVTSFLSKAGFSDERSQEISSYFQHCADLINADEKELLRIRGMTLKEQRKIVTEARKYQFGYIGQACAPPVPRATKPWDPIEDAALLDACAKYDVSFGDPWIYVSSDIGRDPESSRKRYVKISLIPENRMRTCNVIVSASAEPLLFNRDFKLLPPQLLIVPTEENFHLHDLPRIPMAFLEYLDESVL